MDLVVFEENKPLVLQGLEAGEFDYIEAAEEVFETDFFRYLNAKSILSKLAQSYPTPRQKQDVPLWLYVASNLSMRLHGEQAFHAFPMVVRAGGMLNAFGPEFGRKTVHPDTGDVTLVCAGTNEKNHYDRQTPCDQDFLRKLSKDTEAQALLRWFNGDVLRVLRAHRAFNPEGIFIGDASYLFVPDNPRYEGSVKLRFDEHNHPVSQEAFEQMSVEQQQRCQWRRCYKMINLLHTNRSLDFYLLVGVMVVSGHAHECPLLYQLVDQFIATLGKGVMKRLILDRGFLDGARIAECKRKHKIDVLIPVRRNMDIYADAAALFQLPDVRWQPWHPPEPPPAPPPRPRPRAVTQREQKRQQKLAEQRQQQPPPPPEKTVVATDVAAIGDFRSWSSCTVPLSVTATRERYADGHEKTWFLLDTQQGREPRCARDDYGLRTTIEERYRQLKCFSDLTAFTSRAWSLLVNQIVFIILAYNLLQLYLLRKKRQDLTAKTAPRIRRQLLPSSSHIIVYWQNYYGLFEPLELIELLTLTLSAEARQKLGEKSRRLRRELVEALKAPRPP
jgi:hypothetical protein